MQGASQLVTDLLVEKLVARVLMEADDGERLGFAYGYHASTLDDGALEYALHCDYDTRHTISIIGGNSISNRNAIPPRGIPFMFAREAPEIATYHPARCVAKAPFNARATGQSDGLPACGHGLRWLAIVDQHGVR